MTVPADFFLKNLVRTLVSYAMNREHSADDLVELVEISCAEWVRVAAILEGEKLEAVAVRVGSYPKRVGRHSGRIAVLRDLFKGFIYAEYCRSIGTSLPLDKVIGGLSRQNKIAEKIVNDAEAKNINARELAEELAGDGFLKRKHIYGECWYFVEAPLDGEVEAKGRVLPFGGSALSRLVARLEKLANQAVHRDGILAILKEVADETFGEGREKTAERGKGIVQQSRLDAWRAGLSPVARESGAVPDNVSPPGVPSSDSSRGASLTIGDIQSPNVGHPAALVKSTADDDEAHSGNSVPINVNTEIEADADAPGHVLGEDRFARVTAYVAWAVEELLALDAGTLNRTLNLALPLDRFGYDSLSAVDLQTRLKVDLDLDVPLLPLIQRGTAAEVARRIASVFDDSTLLRLPDLRDRSMPLPPTLAQESRRFRRQPSRRHERSFATVRTLSRAPHSTRRFAGDDVTRRRRGHGPLSPSCRHRSASHAFRGTYDICLAYPAPRPREAPPSPRVAR